MAELRERYAYSGNNVEYIGEARPNVGPHQTGWRIRKYIYSGNNVVTVSWADGNALHDKIWNSRSGYSYNVV